MHKADQPDLKKHKEQDRAQDPSWELLSPARALQGERANFSCFLALLYLFPTHIPGREYLIGLT